MLSPLNYALDIVNKLGVTVQKWPGSEIIIEETKPGELEVFLKHVAIFLRIHCHLFVFVMTIVQYKLLKLYDVSKSINVSISEEFLELRIYLYI